MSIQRDKQWDMNEETWDQPFDEGTAVLVQENDFHQQFSNSGLLKFQQKAAKPVFQTRCICGTELHVHVCASKGGDNNTQAKLDDDKGAKYYSRLEELMTKNAIKWTKVEDGPGFQVSGSRAVGKAIKVALKDFETEKKPSTGSKNVNQDPSASCTQTPAEKHRDGIHPA